MLIRKFCYILPEADFLPVNYDKPRGNQVTFSWSSVVLKFFFIEPLVQKIVVVFFVGVSEVEIREQQSYAVLFVFVNKIRDFRPI